MWPIRITSAWGRGCSKKFPATKRTRSAMPFFSTYSSNMGPTSVPRVALPWSYNEIGRPHEPERMRETLICWRPVHLQGIVTRSGPFYGHALKSYDGLDEYTHKVIDHAEKYIDGTVHTNGLENFWSLLKRAIKGTYVSVEPFHLFRYLDAQTFRFKRKDTDAGRSIPKGLELGWREVLDVGCSDLSGGRVMS